MVSLLQPLVNIAVAEAGDRYYWIVNFKTELHSLKRIVSLIEGALPQAEEKQVDNPTIRDWLRELDDICYDARDILDEFVTVAAASIRAKRASKRVKSNSLHSIFLRVWHPFSTGIPFQLRFRIANKIKNLRKRLDSMKKDMETAKLLDFVGGAGCSPNAPKMNRPETGPYPDEHQLVGREVEKKMIMEKLLNLKENDVDVVRIWGMGGVGKTALAQSVFNDDRVTKEQNPTIHRKWLFVGEKQFNAREINRKICELDKNDVADNQGKLKEQFIGKRFLIVLDDVWEVGINEWELFRNPWIRNGNRGLIIITTRSEVDIPAHTLVNLNPLSNTDCQKIFERYAFINRHSCSDLEQKKGIGKQIVEKLKGFPLAAKVVGCSLSNEPNLQIWRSFLDAEEWKLRSGYYDVMPALRWSYNRLPSHLKHCFTYCSLFPKDHVFDEKMLVKMWMASGFIQNVKAGDEKRRPEDIGYVYFNQLFHASLFQKVDNEYVMHDMINELAILVSKEEFFRTNGSQLDDGQLEKVRHISILRTCFWENLSACESKRSTLKRLLTLYTEHEWNSSHITETSIANITQNIFKQLKSIRVLVLASIRITYIPECISELIHLRFLDIENTRVSRIPDTLCDLYNLQTLVARADSSDDVVVLPKNIVNMANLRHLRAHLSTCKGVKNLTSLQELHSISVSEGDKISELGDMRQLHGGLKIKCLENVISEEDAAQAMMQEKTYIDKLSLEFTAGLGDTDVQTKVLDVLQCPPNLTCLQIGGYNGLTSPSWMVDGELIMNLQDLSLLNCHQLELLPPLGQLKCLKHLMFYKCAIKKLGEEFYGKQINAKVFFPSLETLELKCMEDLKEWDDIVIEDTSVKFFPCLKTLFIINCPNLVSALPRVKICTPHMNIKNPLRNAANVSHKSVLELGSNLTRITSFLNGIGEMIVWDCKKLRSLNFSDRGLNSLQSLTVIECPMLETLFEDAPTSSSALRLSSLQTDNELVVLKMFENDLVSLREMYIGIFPNDEFFNKIVNNNWHKLRFLETLAIVACEDLQSLPQDIHYLSSLRQLWLYDCPKLLALPADGLPLSLKLLVILECPLLYERCQVESGTDWYKIKHIPEREIVQTTSVGQVIRLAKRLKSDEIFDIVSNIDQFYEGNREKSR